MWKSLWIAFVIFSAIGIFGSVSFAAPSATSSAKSSPADAAIPKFFSGLGKRYNLEVSPDKNNPNRLRIWISEWRRDEKTFTGQMARAGFQVADGDTVEFLIPREACLFKNTFLINCDSSRLEEKNRATLEISIYESGTLNGPVLHLTGKDFPEHSLDVSIQTSIQKNTALSQNGQLEQSRSLGFESSVWIYTSDQSKGWFFHKISGLTLD